MMPPFLFHIFQHLINCSIFTLNILEPTVNLRVVYSRSGDL